MVTITVKQMAAIKRTAQNVAPLVNQKTKLAQKIVALGEQMKALQEQIDAQQGYVRSIAGGLSTEDLVARVTVPYTNKDGQVSNVARYEPSDRVKFDEDKRLYFINDGAGDDTEVPEVAVEENNNPLDPDNDEEEVAQERLAEQAAHAPENPFDEENA